MSMNRTNGPLWAVISAIVAVVLVAAIAWSLTSRASTESDAAPDAEQVFVAVDGWSWAMRGDKTLEIEADGNRVDADLEPADAGDLDELLAADPNVVTALLARLLVADPSLVCTVDGCTTSSGPVDHHLLVDADDPTLQAQDVTSGVYLARLDVEPTAEIAVSFGGTASAVDSGVPQLPSPTVVDTPAGALLPAPAPVPLDNLPTGEEFDQAQLDALRAELERRSPSTLPAGPDPSSPVPSTGGLAPAPDEGPTIRPAASGPVSVRDADPPEPSTPDVFDMPVEPAMKEGGRVLAVGIAWGQVFELVIPWLTDSTDLVSATAFGAPRQEVEPASILDTPPAPFRNGLAVDDQAATWLTPSQLTAWSSPSIGCGIAVVCAASSAGVSFSGTDAIVHQACISQRVSPEISLDGLGTVQTPVTVVLRPATYDFDESVVRTQLGNWPESTNIPANSPWPVPVPDEGGPFQLQVRAVEVYDGTGLLTMLGSQAPALDGPFDPASAMDASNGLLVPCS